MDCDKHYSIIASKPNIPGAYASCVDEPKWSVDFVMRELAAGAIVRRVTCNTAHRMRGVYLDWLDKQEKKRKAKDAR